MARRYMEIIPPRGEALTEWQGQPAWSAPPRPGQDGPLSSIFVRARANRQARTLRALTETMQAAKAYCDARQLAVQSCRKAQREEYRLRTVPHVAAQEEEQQLEEGEIKLLELERRHYLASLSGDRERAEAESTVSAARHALDVQRQKGDELAWKRRQVDLLDIELAIAERRAILRQHFDELDRAMRGMNSGTAVSTALENALYEARAQLNAHGLDTSALDAALERRNRR
jgi:hypothetical protein